VVSSALSLTQTRSQKPAGDAYLRFELGRGVQAAFLMKQVQEVLVLPPHRLTAMPNMSDCILGLTNRRSRVLWVADLVKLLAIGALPPSPQQYDLIILRSKSTSVAVAVRRVDGILWVDPETIQEPPNHVATSLIPYLRGCVLQSPEILLVLDAEAILQSSVLQGH
jgi:positive phototaxis protein PixI